MLTPKREKFIQAIVYGNKSQRQAYKEAYDCGKMKDHVIDVKASEVFNNGDVKVRYRELMEEVKNRNAWTFDKAVSELLSMLTDAKNLGNYNARFNAIKELNVLSKLYEVEHDIKDPAKLAEILRRMPTEKLEKILDAI